MTHADAVALIRDAVPRQKGMWTDVGAGEGVFTRALAELIGPGSRIYAVDRRERALGALASLTVEGGPTVHPVAADFTRPFDLPDPPADGLDGLLFANALHFAPDPAAVLARLAAWLRPGGHVVLVEYDRRAASRWVPYPIPIAQLPSLAASAGLTPPVVSATRPSAYGGSLYVAAARRR